ncbi:hypothetical protein [Zobellella taiwanensis]|jgi:hypothetical protein
MKPAPLLLLLSVLAAPALAEGLLNRAVGFGRELLDETRKLAPGVQYDKRHETPAPATRPDDGRDAPALEPASTPGAAVLTPPSQPAPATPQSNQGWFVEEDHLK